MKKLIQTLVIIFPVYFAATGQIFSQVSPSTLGYSTIDSVGGSVLYGKIVVNGKNEYKVFCQVIDLKQIKLTHFIDKTNEQEGTQGKYLPQRGFSRSPYFKNYSYDEVIQKFENKGDAKLIGMIGGGFFEMPGPFTQMGFPIKANGKILSAGSSLNGPCENPKHAEFKNIKLKALVWTDSTIAIKDYDPQSGFPLTEDKFPNGFVSYSSNDHPAKIFRPTSANRFVVMGTVGGNQNKNDHLLVTLVIDRARMEFAEGHLRQLGVKDPIIAVSGDATAIIFSQNKGLIVEPSMLKIGDTLKALKLPHYLLVTEKHGEKP